MLIGLRYRGKIIKLNVKKCRWFERPIGLMFSRRERARALLFDFKKLVRYRFHSLFVFFPFLAVWLDKNNKIIDIKKINPFRLSISSKKFFVKVVEIPINKKYKKIIELLVGD